MACYLLVDDRDGSVIAELASADQAGRVLAYLALSQQGDPRVSVVCIDHHQGALAGVASTVAMRPLASPTRRRAPTERSPVRPSRHPPSTQPPRA